MGLILKFNAEISNECYLNSFSNGEDDRSLKVIDSHDNNVLLIEDVPSLKNDIVYISFDDDTNNCNVGDIGDNFDAYFIYREGHLIINNVTGKIKVTQSELNVFRNKNTDNDIKNKIDPITLGIPNINFTLIKKTDDRWNEYKQQRLLRGFDASETWCLTSTISNFILPRLVEYTSIANKILKRDDKLINDINDFKLALELIVNEESSILTPEQQKQLDTGLSKFKDIFMTLWW